MFFSSRFCGNVVGSFVASDIDFVHVSVFGFVLFDEFSFFVLLFRHVGVARNVMYVGCEPFSFSFVNEHADLSDDVTVSYQVLLVRREIGERVGKIDRREAVRDDRYIVMFMEG